MHKATYMRIRHSVDSAVSLRQHHADRIRWPTKARYSQRRSVSDLELTNRQPVPPRSHDLEYFDNPAENLEFAQRRLQPSAPRQQRSATRTDDEYYRHLTVRVQDRWLHGSQGILQAPAALQAALPLPGLRRSRSLAVIREEACAAPLIPRARLVDKPLYKDRFLPRSKIQSKEGSVENIYNKVSSNGYVDLSDSFVKIDEPIYQETKVQNKNKNGWANTNGIDSNTYTIHTDENTYPSEIDSLDSNYIHKNYNFDGHNQGTYKESSPDTTDQDISSEIRTNGTKPLFIRPDTKDVENNYYSAEYAETTKSDTDRSSTLSAHVTKSQTNFHVLDQSNSEYNERESSDDSSLRHNYSGEQNGNESTVRSDTSEEESSKSVERITTLPDKDNISVTSYVSVAISSPEPPSRRLENLAYSLAEKIDEYCESFVEIPLNSHSVTSSFNSKSHDDLNNIYTEVNKIKPNIVQIEPKVKYKDTLERYQKNYTPVDNQLYRQYRERNKGDNGSLKTRSLYRQGSSSKNITTEPFVTTLIENQYYSLPDINISKSLKRSEKIDEKLRQSESNSNSYLQRLDIVDDSKQKTTNEIDLKEVNIIEVKGEEDSLEPISQQDRKIEEAELQIHKEYEEDSLQIEPKSELFNNIDENLKQSCTSVITVDGSIIEVEKKSNTAESLLEVQSFEEDKKTYFTNKIYNIKNKFEKDGDKENCSNTSVLKEDHKKVPELENNEDIKRTIIENPNEPIYLKKKLNPINKPKTSITKHYSLRQRDPTAENSPNISPPNENIEEENSKNPSLSTCCTTVSRGKTHSAAIYDVVIRENRQIQRIHSFKCRKSSSTEENNSNEDNKITILPLSGHQTIIIDGPVKQGNNPFAQRDSSKRSPQLVTKSDDETIHSENVQFQYKQSVGNKTTDSHYHSEGEIDYTPNRKGVPKVKKERSFRIAAVQNKFERPPSRLIIKDKPLLKRIEMSRPQILTITDKRKLDSNKIKLNGTQLPNDNNVDKLNSGMPQFKPQIYNVTEKVDKAVKTDLEYQEKLHSVKNYWSKLIDKSGNEIYIERQSVEMTSPDNICDEYDELNNVEENKCVENVVKPTETVKIVDSIKKNSAEPEIIDVWKKMNETEKEKAESEIEETTLKKIIYDSGKLLEKACNSIKETFNIAATESNPDDIDIKEDQDYKSYSPDIEIVELKGSNDQKDHIDNDVTHATLIKSKSYDRDCPDFDHVRYKIMKSDLFRKSMIAANHKKEAQFDGLLQYLQDYSFQELLVNNNIVIIEPVRTKIDCETFKKPSNNLSTSTIIKKCENVKHENIDSSKLRKLKPGIKRHFFYHPIRINKEIIEEELPNPDTVKTVRNLFERTLTMRRPSESSTSKLSDPETSKRSSSQKNLTDDSKFEKSTTRKKVAKYLTIDTSYGHRKWDSVSLSSGVSSGDLSSNNEHDYDTDALSPFPPTKENNENIYCSSSEEYLCESLNPSLCYESQYVSQDILEKIRECGTSITYYGGKVLDERTGPAISPMTKQIMEEIRGLQRNCCRDCESCQSKCTGGKCDCLYNADSTSSKCETSSVNEDDRISKCCACSEIIENNHSKQDTCKRIKNSDTYLGFKFKLVKSNSCSSRLELAGAGEENSMKKTKDRKLNGEEPIYDNENSVKTKICRIESYRKGIVSSPFGDKNKGSEPKCDITINNQVHNLEIGKVKNENIDKLNSKNVTVHNHRTLAETNESSVEKVKVSRNKNVDLAFAVNAHVTRSSKINEGKTKTNEDKINNGNEIKDTNENTGPSESHKTNKTDKEDDNDVDSREQRTVAETIKCFNEPYAYEKKFYYINNEHLLNGEKKNNNKFGDMVFEEFEVLESSYDSLKNAKLEKK